MQGDDDRRSVGDEPERASGSRSRQQGPAGASPEGRGPTGPSTARREDGPVGRREADGPDGGDSGKTGWLVYVYDLVSSAAIVLLIGGLLFTASGIWPPMVAVESGSMQPVLERGDLVYVMEADRFPGEGAVDGTGIVTYQSGSETGYQKFDDYGDVIVFQPDGTPQGTPTIHRARLYVQKGDDWIERANPDYLPTGIDSCSDIRTCPANQTGFITKGDNNGYYDQATAGLDYEIIEPEWVVGTAEVAVPYLGGIRLGAVGDSRANATAD